MGKLSATPFSDRLGSSLLHTANTTSLEESLNWRWSILELVVLSMLMNNINNAVQQFFGLGPWTNLHLVIEGLYDGKKLYGNCQDNEK